VTGKGRRPPNHRRGRKIGRRRRRRRRERSEKLVLVVSVRNTNLLRRFVKLINLE